MPCSVGLLTGAGGGSGEEFGRRFRSLQLLHSAYGICDL